MGVIDLSQYHDTKHVGHNQGYNNNGRIDQYGFAQRNLLGDFPITHPTSPMTSMTTVGLYGQNAL